MVDATSRAGIEDDLVSPRRLFRACLLLLLEERRGHGYELHARLEALGCHGSTPNRMYRALRWLEGAGLARPVWETGGVGPARRVYELTSEGRQALEIVSPSLRKQAKALDARLARYVAARLRVMAERKQPFEFTVKTTLSVQAIDEASARRKVERVLTQPHALAPDVHSSGTAAIRPATAGRHDGLTAIAGRRRAAARAVFDRGGSVRASAVSTPSTAQTPAGPAA